jgi:hypothetical protein
MKKSFLFSILFISTFASAQVPTYVPLDNLVAWWPFNGNANDESGNGNHGTVSGATLNPDRFGIASGSYLFTGIQNNITITNPFFDNGWTNYSIAFWINPTSNALNGCIMNTTPHDGIGISYSNYGTNKKIYHSKNSNTSVHAWDILNQDPLLYPSFEFGNWYQVILIKTMNTYSYYVNGALDKTISSSISPLNDMCNMVFGNIAPGFAAQPFNGAIDDIGIWNRPLTLCEIQDLYHAQLGSANTSSSQTQVALDTYTWPVNNQTYTQSGVYTDTLVNAAGCDSILTLNLSMEYTGLFDGKQLNAYISPNPVKDQFGLHGATNLIALNLLDVQGKLVQTFDVQQDEFSLSNLKPGIYLLELQQGNHISVFKVMKE